MPVPNEKYTEMLFIYYFMLAVEEQVEFYTPSTREEYLAGYDAHVVGEGLREIYVQFKRPHVQAAHLECRLDLMPHQHERLRQRLHSEAPDAVYYVSHAFTSLRQINALIRQSRCPADLLTHYLAFPLASLSDRARRIRYHLAGATQQRLFESPQAEAWYEQQEDKSLGVEHSIIRCDHLAKAFQRGEIGTPVYRSPLPPDRRADMPEADELVVRPLPNRWLSEAALMERAARSGRYPYETIIRIPLTEGQSSTITPPLSQKAEEKSPGV